MRTLFLLLGCLAIQQTFAQVIQTPSGNNIFLQTVSGQPITAKAVKKYTEGTPFLKDNDWSRGTVVLSNGKSSKDEQLKLNILEGTLHYKDIDGQEMVCVTPVKEVYVENPLGGKPMKFIHSSSLPELKLGSAWLQELTDGTVRLYKQIKKDVKEVKGYSSATTEIYVTDETRYYLLSDNSLHRVKKLKDITELLTTKGEELAKFIREQYLKEKAETDMARLVDYYNSLVKQ
ncbi:MAG TPA: hypothetical protein VD996_14360 [Chitinophagaceae bacterium]|nr:hypothetical protein [Chitinophagaceae bacterium]